MITGNICISSRPSEDDLSDGICADCLCECSSEAINDSFGDGFGNVECWSEGRDCCGADVLQGRIFLDKSSIHTARKDHKDGKVKTGQRYRQNIRKGYYVDHDGGHNGIFEISKHILTS